MASEVCKLAFAYPLLIVFHVGIDGVIVALMAANFAQAATSTALARGALQMPFDPEAGRRWLRRSWLPSLSTLPYILGVADTFIASLVAGGTTTVGFYQAAFSVATLAGYSYFLGAALYPLLLRGGAGSEDLPTITLDLSLLFGIPMAVGAAVLAKPILFVLNPKYVQSTTALEILAFAALVERHGRDPGPGALGEGEGRCRRVCGVQPLPPQRPLLRLPGGDRERRHLPRSRSS